MGKTYKKQQSKIKTPKWLKKATNEKEKTKWKEQIRSAPREVDGS